MSYAAIQPYQSKSFYGNLNLLCGLSTATLFAYGALETCVGNSGLHSAVMAIQDMASHLQTSLGLSTGTSDIGYYQPPVYSISVEGQPVSSGFQFSRLLPFVASPLMLGLAAAKTAVGRAWEFVGGKIDRWEEKRMARKAARQAQDARNVFPEPPSAPPEPPMPPQTGPKAFDAEEKLVVNAFKKEWATAKKEIAEWIKVAKVSGPTAEMIAGFQAKHEAFVKARVGEEVSVEYTYEQLRMAQWLHIRARKLRHPKSGEIGAHLLVFMKNRAAVVAEASTQDKHLRLASRIKKYVGKQSQRPEPRKPSRAKAAPAVA